MSKYVETEIRCLDSGKMWMEIENCSQLDAVKAIREQYNNLIKQERGLVGANTVLDMIDAALEYKQGC